MPERPSTPERSGADPLTDLDLAIAAVEAQRAVLGDAVTDTALGPLRERRAAILSGRAGERRRLVTVLFADLEGFTALSRRLDAEDVRAVVDRCFARWQRVITDHGGVVEKFIGDAVMAVFGLHGVADDDAIRAVRAGLGVVAGLAEVATDTERDHGVRLHVRVGLDSGEVVISTLGERVGHDFVAVGPTVNRASRLQNEAPRDMVLISEATRRLLRGQFGLEPRPGLLLKGIDQPVDAHVVLSERPAGFDLDTAAGVGGMVTATVGRDVDLLALREDLADVVAESRWRITTIVGDAGVGKSRLLAELHRWLAERPEPVWWFRGRASPSAMNRPHTLLRDAVSTRFRIGPDDPPATVLDRCVRGFRAAGGSADQAAQDARIVARWLGFTVDFTVDPVDDPAPADPQRLRDEATRLLAGHLVRLAEQAPVVIMLEDLHWADDASLEWLDAVEPILAHVPVWVVTTTRPTLSDRRPHWGEGLAHHARLPLSPLSPRQSRALLAELLRRVDDVPDEITTLLVDAAEGNPYYLEELVTWLVDEGVIVPGEPSWTVARERVGSLRVPATLQGVLQSRLDGLSTGERSTLQRASVVGRVFWDTAVARLADRTDDTDGAPTRPAEALTRLRGRDLVLRRDGSRFEGATEWVFKHALLRDVAYEAMLRPQRRAYHGRMVAWLTEVGARNGRADELAYLIAEHADRADDPDAARWYLRAGRRAAGVYAAEEALRLFERGLELAGTAAGHGADDLVADLSLAHEALCQARGERERQLVDLDRVAAVLPRLDRERRAAHDLARSRLAFDTSDYVAAVEWAARAEEAAEQAGLGGSLAQARLWAGKAHTWSGDGDAARASLAGALEAARREGAWALEAETLRYQGMLAGNEGDYPGSVELLERARDLFAAHADFLGEGTALTQLATTCFHQGRLAEARRLLEQARPAFTRAGHHYGLSVVLGNLAATAAGLGELGPALGWLAEAVEVSRWMRDAEATATNLVARAEVEVHLGRLAECRAHAAEGAAEAARVGNDGIRSTALATQALAAAFAGDHDEAGTVAAEALEAAEGHPKERMVALVNGVQVRLAADRAAPVGALLDEARALAEELGLEPRLAEIDALEVLAAVGGPGGGDEVLATASDLLARLDDDGGHEGAEVELVWLACWEAFGAAQGAGLDDLRARLERWVAARAVAVGVGHAEEYRRSPVVRRLPGGDNAGHGA